MERLTFPANSAILDDDARAGGVIGGSMSKRLAAILAAVAFVAGAAVSFGVTELAQDHQPASAGVRIGDGG